MTCLKLNIDNVRRCKRHLFSEVEKIVYNKKRNRRLNIVWFVADLEKLDDFIDCYRELRSNNIKFDCEHPVKIYKSSFCCGSYS